MRKFHLISVLLVLLIVPQAHAWYYHLSLNITETSGANLTNYPVYFILNTSYYIEQGLMRSDCLDMVVYINSTEVPFFVEDCNTNNSKVWFRVPYLPANSHVVVDVYFGDPTVYNKYSPNDVFIYYNDFESADDVANFSGDLIYSTDYAYHGVGSAYKNDSGLNCLPNGTFNIHDNVVVEGYILAQSDLLVDRIMLFNDSNYGVDSGVIHSNNTFFAFSQSPFPNYSGASTVMSADPIGVWTRRVIIFLPNAIYFRIYDLSGNLLAYINFTENKYNYTKICFYGTGAGAGSTEDYHYYIDYIRIKPYASSEPEVNVSQIEQLFLPKNIDRCGDIMFSGEYFLNTSLLFGDAVTTSDPLDFQYCVRILASNVTLNCVGHSILGNDNILYNENATYKPMVAISVIGAKNVKIVNCNIFNATYPIRIENSSVTISNLKTDAGMHVRNSTLTITDSQFYGIPFNTMKSILQSCGFNTSGVVLTNVWSLGVTAPDSLRFPTCGRYWVLDYALTHYIYELIQAYPIPPHIGIAGSKVIIERTVFENNAPSIVSASIGKILEPTLLVPPYTNFSVIISKSFFNIDYMHKPTIIDTMFAGEVSIIDSDLKYSGGYHIGIINQQVLSDIPKQISPRDYSVWYIIATNLVGNLSVLNNQFYGIAVIVRGPTGYGNDKYLIVNNIYYIFPSGGLYLPYEGNFSLAEIRNNYYGLYSCEDFLRDGSSLDCPTYYWFGDDYYLQNNITYPYDKSPSDLCNDSDKDGVCDSPLIFNTSFMNTYAIDTAPYSYYYLHPVLKIGTGTTFMQIPPNFEEEIKQKILIIPRYLRVYIPTDRDYGMVEFQVINNGDRELYFYFDATDKIMPYIKAPKLGRYYYIPPNSGKKFQFVVDGYNKTETTYGRLYMYVDFPEKLIRIPITVEITRESPTTDIAWVLIPIIILLVVMLL